MSDRGVSSPVGVVLLLGITVMAVTTLFIAGGAVLSDTRADAERSQTENAMAQFSSKASLVGLGESGDQRFAMGRLSEGEMSVDPDAGNVTLFFEPDDGGGRTELNSTSLGAVVYRAGGREIAYQGGGVWEKQDGWSRMVSPPEYHYRLETLTFPIMTVDGGGRASGDVRGTVRAGGPATEWYPIEGTDRSNPLDNGTIVVRVESRYCSGWQSFFEQRSQGVLEETCGDDGAIEIDLVVPFEIESESPVTAKAIERNGNSGVPDSWRDDVVAPSVSPQVEAQREACGCDPFPESGTVTEGAYLSEDVEIEGGRTFDTSDGDITVVVEDELDIEGDDGGTIDVDGPGDVTFYVYDEVTMGGGASVNAGGSADQFSVLVHSDAGEDDEGDGEDGDDRAVSLNGNVRFTGLVYAPKSSVFLNGNAEIDGAVVGDSVRLNGNPTDVTGADELDGYNVVGGDRTLTYLHVSENPIEVELDG